MKCNFLYELQLPPEPLTWGLPPPDPYPLSSTEFVEPLPQKKFLSTPLAPWEGKKNLMTARVSMMLKSRASLTCF